MTEEEARKKWCPMVRHAYGSEPVSNRVGDADLGMVGSTGWNACIASSCMMWVYNSDSDGTYKTGSGRCGLAR